MSGLVAHLALDRPGPDRELLARMAARCPHRGPDGFRAWSDAAIALGHQAFRTAPGLPRSRTGPQPLALPEEGLALVFAGVLYHRAELERGLERAAGARGADYAAEPDELLALHAYREWGPECVRRLAGDFALAVWDARASQLFAAVDPAGIRPLHYHEGPRAFLLASEAQQLFAAPWVGRELDARVVHALLAESFPGDGSTVFREVKRLPGGCALTWRQGAVRVHRYWDPPRRAVRFPRDGDYVERFRELLGEAVASRLRARGPVAIHVSGGLDSCSIAATAARAVPPGGLRAITAVFDGFDEYERELARAVPAMYGVPHHEIAVANDRYHETEARYLRDQADPFLIHDPVLFERMCESARSLDCRVVLTGLGGNQALSSVFLLLNSMRSLRVRRAWREFRRWHELEGRQYYGSLPRAALVWARWLVPEALVRPLSRQRREVRRLLKAEPGARRAPRWGGSFRRAEYELDVPATGLPDPWVTAGKDANIMASVERIFSRCGTEARHPFYDSRLLEYLLGVPERILVANGLGKAILREAMRGILPDSLLGRVGNANYQVLLHAGIRQENGARLRGLLGGELASSRFVHEATVRRWARASETCGLGPDSRQLPPGVPWGSFLRLRSLEMWLREWPGGEFALDARPPGGETEPLDSFSPGASGPRVVEGPARSASHGR